MDVSEADCVLVWLSVVMKLQIVVFVICLLRKEFSVDGHAFVVYRAVSAVVLWPMDVFSRNAYCEFTFPCHDNCASEQLVCVNKP